MKSPGQKASQKQEKRLEKSFDGRRTAASGAFWSSKGDVKADKYLIEAKTTAAKSFSLKSSELKKIETEALLVGKVPLLCVELVDRNYVVLLEDDFLELESRADTPSA